MKYFFLALGLAAMLTLNSAAAQLTTLNAGGKGGGGVVTPCTGGQLDWSDATGCNLTLYMIGLR